MVSTVLTPLPLGLVLWHLQTIVLQSVDVLLSLQLAWKCQHDVFLD